MVPTALAKVQSERGLPMGLMSKVGLVTVTSKMPPLSAMSTSMVTCMAVTGSSSPQVSSRPVRTVQSP